jgi:hypothetical protein
MVVGQAPAGIERHAEAVHRSPPEQRFKPQLRGHHVHRLRSGQQGGGVATIGREAQAIGAEAGRGQATALATRRDIGMGLDQDRAVGMVGQGGVEHGLEALGIGLAMADRKIAEGLIHHQHIAFLRHFRLPGAVVFADPLLAPQLTQGPGASRLLRGERPCNQLLEATGAIGVVIDAEIINHQGERRTIRSKAEGAQEAILTTPERQPAVMGDGRSDAG